MAVPEMAKEQLHDPSLGHGLLHDFVRKGQFFEQREAWYTTFPTALHQIISIVTAVQRMIIMEWRMFDPHFGTRLRTIREQQAEGLEMLVLESCHIGMG